MYIAFRHQAIKSQDFSLFRLSKGWDPFPANRINLAQHLQTMFYRIMVSFKPSLKIFSYF